MTAPMLQGIPPGPRRALQPIVFAAGVVVIAVTSIGVWALGQMLELMEEDD